MIWDQNDEKNNFYSRFSKIISLRPVGARYRHVSLLDNRDGMSTIIKLGGANVGWKVGSDVGADVG